MNFSSKLGKKPKRSGLEYCRWALFGVGGGDDRQPCHHLLHCRNIPSGSLATLKGFLTVDAVMQKTNYACPLGWSDWNKMSTHFRLFHTVTRPQFQNFTVKCCFFKHGAGPGRDSEMLTVCYPKKLIILKAKNEEKLERKKLFSYVQVKNLLPVLGK